MRFSPGVKIGPYQITAQIGAGGMGEVYRAKDPRLGRDVAIKVLPEAFSKDPERLRRFEQEARAAGMLNHPNILAIYDIGVHEGSPYVVSELLEGETLRERLRQGAAPQRKAIEYALRTSQGLTAAHQKGIIHRDLKPENLFITTDGRVKILDFGLAKLTEVSMSEDLSSAATESFNTNPGVVMGTLGYMSPEQVRGKPVDPRSDIFSLGAVLYEMLSGKRAFHGESAVEAMHSILKADPLEIPDLSPAIDRLMRHCLEKEPAQRFQTAQDLAFALESVSGSSQPSGMRVAMAPEAPRTSIRWVYVLAAASLALAAAGYWIGFMRGDTSGRQTLPVYQKLTFRRGNIGVARFTPDGQTVVYGAAWENKPQELYSSRVDSIESRSLGIDATGLVAISSSGEMIVNRNNGILARLPLAGGAPRDFAQGALIADWAPDGKTIAIVTRSRGVIRIEYPAGKVLAEIPNAVRSLRISPKGDMFALTEVIPDSAGDVIITLIDLKGTRRVLLNAGRMAGIGWSPDGKEIWYSAGHGSAPDTLYAVDLAGKSRILARIPGVLALQDVSRDGVILAESDNQRRSLMCLTAGDTKERDLSWLDSSSINSISDDGKILLFTEVGAGGGTNSTFYLRNVDGSPAVRLGEGRGRAISPDGGWVLASQSLPTRLMLSPTGAGETRVLDPGTIENVREAVWFPDGNRILFAGKEAGHDWRLYSQDLVGGKPRAVSPEGVSNLGPLSPDGKTTVIPGARGQLTLYTLETGERRPLPIEPAWGPVRWASNGRELFIAKEVGSTIRVERIDVQTGRRQLWKEIAPIDPDVLGSIIRGIDMTPDGKTYAYTYSRTLSTLYLIKGLR